jgi:hypothetical protein
MAFTACSNCGTKVYSGLCPNCNELEFIQREFEEYVASGASHDDHVKPLTEAELRIFDIIRP